MMTQDYGLIQVLVYPVVQEAKNARVIRDSAGELAA
jgi:hypothetical protein